MKKFMLKLNLVALSLTCVFPYSVCAEASNASEFQVIGETANNDPAVEKAVANADATIGDIKSFMDRFFNEKDKTSVNAFIAELKAKIVKFNTEVINPLQDNVTHGGSVAVNKAHEISQDLKVIMTDFCTALEKNSKSTAISLGLALANVKNKAKNTLKSVAIKLNDLQKSTTGALSEKIGQLKVKLITMLKAGEANTVQLLTKLRHRVNCKDTKSA